MTSARATEFLTKQLSIERETVTFRWLSRKLSVHVNVAKNELASFYASCRSTDAPVHATYLLTGDVAPIKAADSYRDDDHDDIDKEDCSQSVATSKIVLVGEDDLEVAKAQFTRAPSVHIYSLSPSAIRDAALLAPMADRVRPDDVSKGKSYNQTIGIVVGPDVKIGQTIKPGTSTLVKTNPSPASSSHPHTPAAAKTVAEHLKSSEKGKALEKSNNDEKKKGTLDWSKVKVKGKEQENIATTAKTSSKEVMKESKLGLGRGKVKQEVKEDEISKVKVKTEPTESTVTTKVVKPDKLKRGTKRPSAVLSLSDSEDDNFSPKTKARTLPTPLTSRPPSRTNSVKVKNGVLLSDDDEERAKEVKSKTTRRKGKGRSLLADEEEEEEEEEVNFSDKAPANPDDSPVTSHNNRDHQPDEDIEMPSDDEPMRALPKTKRKPKKVIPIGKNGYSKRRVIKSRKSKNAKGYTITEDYSSYESVSESEQAPPTSDTETRQKTRKRSKKEDMDRTGASKANGSTKSKHKIGNHSAKTKGESQSVEGKSEAKKPESGTGSAGSISTSVAKVSNGDKNLMSYFTKK